MDIRPQQYDAIAIRPYFGPGTVKDAEAFNRTIMEQAADLEALRGEVTALTGETGDTDRAWNNTNKAPLTANASSLLATVDTLRARAFRWLDIELGQMDQKMAIQATADTDHAVALGKLDEEMLKASSKALAKLKAAGLEDVICPKVPACDAIARQRRELEAAKGDPLVSHNDRWHYGIICERVRDFIRPLLPVL